MKFDNGVLICWKTVRVTVHCDAPWGSLFESELLDFGVYPHNFKSGGGAPTVSLCSNVINASFEGLTENNTENIGKARMYRPTTATITGDILIQAIGIWK